MTGVRARVRQALVETFALHQSRSVQHTSTRWPKARSRRCGDITEVTLRLPNRHHELANLTPFGLDNPNEVFIPTEEPYGLIEATIKRS